MNNLRIPFLNTQIDNVTAQEALAIIKDMVIAKQSGYVVTPNINHIIRLENDPFFAAIYDKADLILTDGQPMIWISKLFRTPIKEKISGSDFFPQVCELASQENFKMFLLGADTGIAEKAAACLQLKFTGLQIVGIYSPPKGFEQNPAEIAHIIELVNNSDTDILCFALGTPKQEQFFYQYQTEFNNLVALHFGAALDFVSGHRKRAPKWLQNAGLEWFFRVCQEPRRLFRRYFIENLNIFKIILKYQSILKK